jgi:hypothetical protein
MLSLPISFHTSVLLVSVLANDSDAAAADFTIHFDTLGFWQTKRPLPPPIGLLHLTSLPVLTDKTFAVAADFI